MAHLIANLPTIRCYVRKEFLYNFEKGHGEYEPCFWVSLKSIRGEAFRIESYLPHYAALYDKLPLHAYVWRTDIDIEKLLPLDHLQIWDCLSYDITILDKKLLSGMSCKFFTKSKEWMEGEYMFTVDQSFPDPNIIDTTFSEDIEDHKSFNFVKCDNGQFAAQPNNRIRIHEPSFVTKKDLVIQRLINTNKWDVESYDKWMLEDSNAYNYDILETEVDK